MSNRFLPSFSPPPSFFLFVPVRQSVFYSCSYLTAEPQELESCSMWQRWFVCFAIIFHQWRQMDSYCIQNSSQTEHEWSHLICKTRKDGDRDRAVDDGFVLASASDLSLVTGAFWRTFVPSDSARTQITTSLGPWCRRLSSQADATATKVLWMDHGRVFGLHLPECATSSEWACSWWDHGEGLLGYFLPELNSLCCYRWQQWVQTSGTSQGLWLDSVWMHECSDQCLQRCCYPGLLTHSSHVRLAIVRVCSFCLHGIPFSFLYLAIGRRVPHVSAWVCSRFLPVRRKVFRPTFTCMEVMCWVFVTCQETMTWVTDGV